MNYFQRIIDFKVTNVQIVFPKTLIICSVLFPQIMGVFFVKKTIFSAENFIVQKKLYFAP